MTTSEERQVVIRSVDEAISAGVSIKRICDNLDISERTIQRWRRRPEGDNRKGSARFVKSKLTLEEKENILNVCN
jgi:putative transposase